MINQTSKLELKHKKYWNGTFNRAIAIFSVNELTHPKQKEMIGEHGALP